MIRKLSFYSMSLLFIVTVMFSSIASAANESKTADQSKATNSYLSVSRAVTLLVEHMDLNIDHIKFIKEPKASDIFTRISDNASYAEAFIIAYHNGLAIPEDVDPEQKMTREWFAHLLFQAIETKGDYAFIEIFLLIEDEQDITPEYMNSIQKLLISKIASLNKNNEFRPQEQMTWGNAMVWISKAKTFVKKMQPIEQPSELPVPDDVELIVSNVNEDIQKVTVSWGEKPNSGYGITIDQIQFEEDKAIVYYSLHYPEPDKMYLQVITEPKAETYISSQYKPVIQPLDSGKGMSDSVSSSNEASEH